MNSISPNEYDELFFKFNNDSKIARKMIQIHAPNKLQERICDKLGVPYLLWSFYKCKIVKIVRTNFFSFIPHPFCRGTSAYDDFLNTHEKFFLVHYRQLDHIRRSSICVQKPLPSLQDQCIAVIVQQTSNDIDKLKELNFLLPQTVLERIFCSKGYVPMPKWNRQDIRARFVKITNLSILCELFKQKDIRFSKEFVVWFQNEDLCFDQIKDTHQVIFYYFVTDGNTYNSICLTCMKESLKSFKIMCPFKRHYFNVNDFRFHHMQFSSYWCIKCKQVPLFQILSLQDYEVQYGEQKGITTLHIKVEYFI